LTARRRAAPAGASSSPEDAQAFAVLDLNEEMFPSSSGMSVFRGNIHLMHGDTTTAAEA